MLTIRKIAMAIRFVQQRDEQSFRCETFLTFLVSYPLKMLDKKSTFVLLNTMSTGGSWYTVNMSHMRPFSWDCCSLWCLLRKQSVSRGQTPKSLSCTSAELNFVPGTLQMKYFFLVFIIESTLTVDSRSSRCTSAQ